MELLRQNKLRAAEKQTKVLRGRNTDPAHPLNSILVLPVLIRYTGSQRTRTIVFQWIIVTKLGKRSKNGELHVCTMCLHVSQHLIVLTR